MDNKQQNWLTLLPETIFGAEDDDQETNSTDSSDSSDDNAGGAGSDSDDSSGTEHDDANDPKVKGLKTALETERAAAKAAQKRANALQKEKDERELAEKTAIDQAEIKATKAEEKAAKLAEGLLTRDVNDAIKAAASKAGFIDTDDALAGIPFSLLTYEQDDEDPSDITIDLKSVEKAVKDLATKKPHFLKAGTEDGEPSGGKFGNRQKKQSTEADSYKELYPSLR